MSTATTTPGARAGSTNARLGAFLTGFAVAQGFDIWTRTSTPLLPGMAHLVRFEAYRLGEQPRLHAPVAFLEARRHDSTRSVRVEQLATAVECQRQGLASHLMDLALTAWDGLAVDHGDRTAAGQQWWNAYTR